MVNYEIRLQVHSINKAVLRAYQGNAGCSYNQDHGRSGVERRGKVANEC